MQVADSVAQSFFEKPSGGAAAQECYRWHHRIYTIIELNRDMIQKVNMFFSALVKSGTLATSLAVVLITNVACTLQ